MKAKLKIIIPMIIAAVLILLAFIFIRFSPSQGTDIASLITTAQKYLVEQNYDMAIAEFEKAIELDPKNTDAYIGIAQAYELTGDTEKALEWLQKGYDLTGDPALKAEMDRINGMSAAVTAVDVDETSIDESEREITTAESVETSETAETVDAAEAAAEEIRAKAVSVMEMFNVYKETAEPNSVVYYYLPGEGSVTKCEYNENGELTLAYEQRYSEISKSCSGELKLLNYEKYSSELYRYYSVSRGSDGIWEKYCYCKCFLDHFYSDNLVSHYGNNLLRQSDLISMTDSCYVFEDKYNHDTISVYVDSSNELTDITVESEHSLMKFSNNNGNWTGNYSSKFSDYSYDLYPCVNTLPEGVSDEDFMIPKDTDDCKVFYDWNEYNNYSKDYLSH